MANFVRQWVRHVILTQNEPKKKIAYIYGLGPRDQKVQKTLKFHVFSPLLPPHGGEKGAKSPKWSLVILL